MIKKSILCIALLTAAALTGCGQESSSSEKTAGVTKPAQTEETTAAETTEPETVLETVTETETETTEVTTTETVTETEAVTETTAAQVTAEENIISGVELGDNKDDVLGKFGDYNGSFDGVSKPSTTYNYSIDGSELFGVDMKGIMFFEFSNRTDELICYGYRFGNVISDGRDTYPYSGDELKTAYEKVLDKLIGWYGGSAEESDLTGIFKEYIISLEDDSEVWSVYGVNMWGENSGVNEVIVSHAISNEKMMAI